MDPDAFRELVSGRRRGLSAAATRLALRGLEVPYSAAVRYRNRRYDAGRARVQRVEAPVVSVGNLTLGGTGKTPTVEWLARWFTKRGVRVALVSRGYGSRDGRPNDEALELAEKLPGVPHVLDPDRVRGARRAIDELGSQLILLDDGFQHRRLGRDFDLVLIDALEPFGFEHVFPRGTLREPLAGWARADALLLSRSELVDEPRRREIRQRVSQYAPGALWLEATFAPCALRDCQGDERPLDLLEGKPVAAFCGIGNPAAFRDAIARAGCRLIELRVFGDHFAYPPTAVEELAQWSDRTDAAAVVCTHKDLVKVGSRFSGGKPLWALCGRLEIGAGLAGLEARLAEIARRAAAR